jgi:HD domain
MPPDIIHSDRVRRAMQMAEQARSQRERKTSKNRYRSHLIAATGALAAAGAGDDLLCAGYLYAVVEDEAVSVAEVEGEFGHRVARLVGAVTTLTEPGGTEQEKYLATVAQMSEADAELAALKAADLLADISDPALMLDRRQGKRRQPGHQPWEQVVRTDEAAALILSRSLRLADVLIGRLAYHGAFPALIEQLRTRASVLRDLAPQPDEPEPHW